MPRSWCATKRGQRRCETQAGQGYGRWKASANTTNAHSPRLAGVQFLNLAGLSRWSYSDGRDGPPHRGRFISETYPYATLVGAAELGYGTERPRCKRKPPRLPAAQWRTERAANCDTLIRRLGQLATACPPILLHSHPVTRELAEQPSPASDAAYKHREDLIDALLCAWTASLWARHGFARCQVPGLPDNASDDPAATMIVPARPEQRRHPLHGPALPAAGECVWSRQALGANMASVHQYVDDDAGYLEWIGAHPRSFVLSTYRKPTPAYLMLHHASCWTIRVRSNWTKGYR
jgi:predicted RNase H-like nuclease